jgi:hypothetical protein
VSESTVFALKSSNSESANVRKGERRIANISLQFSKTPQGWKSSEVAEPSK